MLVNNLLDVHGREGCATFPYTFVFSSDANDVHTRT